MSDKRIFYATQAVLLAGSTIPVIPWVAANVVKGVQSVGVNTSIGKRLIRDLGVTDPFAILEDKPTVEVSLDRIIASTSDIIFPSSGGDLLASHASEYDILLLVGEESKDQIDTLSATTQAELSLSYLQISSVSYEFNVSGPVSESITFTGHNKNWVPNADRFTFSVQGPHHGPLNPQPGHGPVGELGFPHSANISKREHYSISSSIIPSEVQGALQSINISFDLSRREIGDLGKRQGAGPLRVGASEGNKYKLLNLPVEVTTTLTTIIAAKDFTGDISAQSFSNTPSSAQIRVVLNTDPFTSVGEITFDMGSKNALEDVSRSGGDSAGGNVEASYTYKNYNTFSIS
jgi:hypothetical protein